ncbi:hypothetical protein ACS5PJ_14475 [Pseudarthrobacter sp. YS3]|uniref:hypothetical protein n=1 Tax=Pseudarthrobacter sp. YS3 TaxID=3453718 RepID=UPI003EEF0190
MTYSQVITPNPDIPCKPGWCLAYVNEAFGVRKVYGSATAAWNGSSTKHRDYDFPAGYWVPVWFHLANEPNGHVALLAPDGSVYSTSDDSTTPHHHPDLADLIAYYWRNPLTYLGWTEDVEGTPVIATGAGTISYASDSITPTTSTEELDMSAEENILARITETVGWQNAQFQDIRDTAERNRNALAAFVRDVVAERGEITAAEIDAKFAALTSAPAPAGTLLYKGKDTPDVYVWDASSGFRHIGIEEFVALTVAGANLRELDQAIIDALPKA